MTRRLASALLAATLAGAGCGGPAPVPGSSPKPVPEAGPRPPALDPGSLDQVSALAVGDGVVFVGGEAGILRLDPLSGAYSLLPEADGASSTAVAALGLAPDGTLWSAHRAEPGEPAGSEGLLRGGVRALAPGEARPRAWGPEDGLGDADVAALAVSGLRVVVGLGGALAQRPVELSSPGFERFFDEPSRRLEVVSFDEEGASSRRVFEFRPRGEQVLSLALAEPKLWIGTTHGLYRLHDGELRRYEVPCRVEARPPRRVHALAASEDGVVAVLGLDTDEGEWRPGGVLELEGEAAWRCHEPDLDVPDSPSLSVSRAEGAVWLATYEGPTRILGPDAELLDEAAGAPRLPATSVVAQGREACWVGTWGGGAWRLAERGWRSYSFAGGPSGAALIRQGALR